MSPHIIPDCMVVLFLGIMYILSMSVAVVCVIRLGFVIVRTRPLVTNKFIGDLPN